MTRGFAWAWLLVVVLGCVSACSDKTEPASSPKADSGPCAHDGVALEHDETDTHCAAGGTKIVQPIGECLTGQQVLEAGLLPDGGAEPEPDIPPHASAEADDDDCKYHVVVQSACAASGAAATFDVSVTALTNGSPAGGAKPTVEAHMAEDELHISPTAAIAATETSPGTYSIGPLLFDAPGRWVLRLHFYPKCSDLLEDSPHAHVAFFVDVP